MRIRTESTMLMDRMDLEYLESKQDKYRLLKLIKAVHNDIRMLDQHIDALQKLRAASNGSHEEYYVSICCASARLGVGIREMGFLMASVSDPYLDQCWLLMAHFWTSHRNAVSGLDDSSIPVSQYLET